MKPSSQKYLTKCLKTKGFSGREKVRTRGVKGLVCLSFSVSRGETRQEDRHFCYLPGNALAVRNLHPDGVMRLQSESCFTMWKLPAERSPTRLGSLHFAWGVASEKP